MPVSGSGVGFPIAPAGIAAGTPTGLGGPYGIPYSHLSIEEYAEWVQMPEPFLYGIRNHPDLVEGKGCGDYWNQTDRIYLANAIAKSEKRLKADRWLGFPIRREYNDMIARPRQLEWSWPAYLGKYLRGIGVEAETDLQNSLALTLSGVGGVNDPVTFSLAVTFTDEDEVLIYYPGQRKYRIRPSSVIISGGILYVEIPRSRLLKPEYMINFNNVNDRPDYQDDSYFLTTVDVVRNYLDTTTGANLVWHRRLTDTLDCCITEVTVCDPANPCGETLQLACGYIRSQRDGEVQFEPATYNGGWVKSSWAIKRWPDGIQANHMRFYADRYEGLEPDLVRAIIALAHSNMPSDTCFRCSIQQSYYKRDVTPIEPPVSLGLGPSTWGVYEAVNIVREFDAKLNGHHGGML